MAEHEWDVGGLSTPQNCIRCGVKRELAGPWWLYTRGHHYLGIISPTPPCEPAEPCMSYAEGKK